MWKKFKSLWRGKTVTAADGDGWDDEAGAVAPPPAKRDAVDEGLSHVDAAMAAEDAGLALHRMRPLLLAHGSDPRVLSHAATVLAAVGEPGLADGFARASSGRPAAPLVDLAAAFLELDDGAIALSLADAAIKREPNSPRAVFAAAAALAQTGQHARLLERFQPFAETWSDLALKRRYAASAALLRRWSAYDAVADELGAEPADDVVRAMAGRARVDEGGLDTSLRELLFIRYGAALLSPVSRSGAVGAGDVAAWLVAAARILGKTMPDEARLAYVSSRGELAARWLALSLRCPVLPLSARLPDQPLVVVLADGADVEAMAEVESLGRGPTGLFQLLVDPAALGAPVPDIIGAIATDATLPFEVLQAERAADRLSPKMAAAALAARAAEPDGATTDAFWAWAEPRLAQLTATTPAAISARALFDGDVR